MQVNFKNVTTKSVIIILLLIFVLGLSGCRDTDVLNQLIQSQEFGEIDLAAIPLIKNQTNRDENPDLSDSVIANDSLTLEDLESIPTYDIDFSDDSIANQSAESFVGFDTDLTEGDNPSESSNGDGNENGENGSGNGDGNDNGENGNENGTTDNGGNSSIEDPIEQNPDYSNDEELEFERPGGNNQNGESGNSGIGGDARYYNDGTYADLPKGTRTIAAVGDNALIVQMLSGGGSLVAADENWLANIRNTGAFPNEGIEMIEACWSGNGTAAGSVNISKLIEVNPDVVLISSNTSTSTLTSSEIDTLTNAGISVVLMPALGAVNTGDNDITIAVRVVGELLKSATHLKYDTVKMANAYVEYHDEVLENAYNANGGFAQKYYYPPTGVGPFGGKILQGSNATQGALMPPNKKFSPNLAMYTIYIDDWSPMKQNYYTTSGGNTYDVSDGIGLGTKLNGGSGRFPLWAYYAQHAGVVDRTTSAQFIHGSSGSPISPIVSTLEYQSLIEKPYDYDISDQSKWDGQHDDGPAFGTSNYHVMTVRDKSYADRIVNSAAKSNGPYRRSHDYEVWVLPSGLAGSYADGNVESFLIASWAYGMFYGKNISVFESDVNNFYNAFYRCAPAGIVTDYTRDGIYFVPGIDSEFNDEE